jgi:hypothetical protein
MKMWATQIWARDPKDNKLKKWGGPNIPAPSRLIAQEYCDQNGMGYCYVDAELIAEIPANENHDPIWDKMIDYDTMQKN